MTRVDGMAGQGARQAFMDAHLDRLLRVLSMFVEDPRGGDSSVRSVLSYVRERLTPAEMETFLVMALSEALRRERTRSLAVDLIAGGTAPQAARDALERGGRLQEAEDALRRARNAEENELYFGASGDAADEDGGADGAADPEDADDGDPPSEPDGSGSAAASSGGSSGGLGLARKPPRPGPSLSGPDFKDGRR